MPSLLRWEYWMFRDRRALGGWFDLRFVCGLVGAAFLAACSVQDTVLNPAPVTNGGNAAWVGNPDFNWHLSGDKRVAPRQVFSGGGRVWIQWHPNQSVPIIFARVFDQWSVVDARQHSQYSVIEGTPSELRFQGGKIVAYAVHRASSGVTVGGRFEPECPKPATYFELRVSDKTIRQALDRWATEHLWHFDDAHWDLPYDLPVTAPAKFGGDFSSAVEQLLSAVSISGRAVKACFYANHVLRVVPVAQSCDPASDKGDK
jgi:hypothetical protein